MFAVYPAKSNSHRLPEKRYIALGKYSTPDKSFHPHPALSRRAADGSYPSASLDTPAEFPEFDPAKDTANQSKQGVSLALAGELD